jgi:hypothetical protein
VVADDASADEPLSTLGRFRLLAAVLTCFTSMATRLDPRTLELRD